MADFDSFDYDIESRLPEWWKGFGALEPVNYYTQQLIAEILQGLLTTMGVVQPLNCWLNIPEEYTWYHHYKPTDDYLIDNRDTSIINNAVTTLFPNNETHAVLPNTKRNCHAKIQLRLLGTEINRTEEGEIDKETGALVVNKEIIEKLTIQNADQIITFNNIDTTSTIEILTETNEILIDGVERTDLIEGKINKIRPVIKNQYYQTPYIDNNKYNPIKIKSVTSTNEDYTNLLNEEFFIQEKVEKGEKIYQIFQVQSDHEERIYIKITNILTEEESYPYYECIFCDKNGENTFGTGVLAVIGPKEKNINRYIDIDVEDENKKTELIIHSSEKVDYDLQVYLYKPTYTTEQNIRIASVSAFPIEWVRLYGYFCHPFNDKSGYKFLWEKNYKEESRTVYDRITKQYDCERFYIQVKFQGIGAPLTKGFPQEIDTSNPAFQLNPNLDKWGRIYGLPRRFYKTDITEDEEPYTFPKYYNYPVEQDYWYEERMVNEYRFENDSVNSLFVKDSEFNNIGVLECIYPFMDDIWVYTETIDPSSDTIQKVQNEDRDDIPLSYAIQEENSLGVDWKQPQRLISNPISIKLNPQSNEVKKQNDFSYQTKKIKLGFSLNEFEEATPKDITIKGIELKFKTEVNAQPNTIKLGEDCTFILPYRNENSDTNYSLEKINIVRDDIVWLEEKGYFTIGGKDNLFQEKEISREQLFAGNEGRVEFELMFINENDFLQADLYLQNVSLNIYYEIISNEYEINVDFDKKEIDLNDEEKKVNMDISIKNTGKIEVHDKEIFVVLSPELKIENDYNSYLFDLDIGEEIGNKDVPPIRVPIVPANENEIPTGWYDVIVICEDKIFSNEILIKGNREDSITEINIEVEHEDEETEVIKKLFVKTKCSEE